MVLIDLATYSLSQGRASLLQPGALAPLFLKAKALVSPSCHKGPVWPHLELGDSGKCSLPSHPFGASHDLKAGGP
jgi:hypothetical protein